MRRFLIAAALFLLAPLCYAQNLTTVTATVKDSNNTAYSFGSYTVSLVNSGTQQPTFGGNPNFQTIYQGSLDTTGLLSVALPSVTVMQPLSQLQWKFLICANPKSYSAVFPQPANPVCFTYTSTGTQVSGASVDLGSSFTVTTIPLVAGTSSGLGFSSGYIDPTQPANGGVKSNGNAIFDATFTNGSNIVTSATAKFQTGVLPAVVGMRAVGSCCGQAGGMAHVGSVIQIGASSSCLIASIQSDTQVTLTGGCNSSANQSNAMFAWVPDDTAAWQTAITKAWGNAGHCKPIFFPGGLTGINDSIGNTTTCKNELTNANTTASFIGGFGGRTGGYFVILPEFVTNAMTGGHCTAAPGVAGQAGCLFSNQGIEIDSVGFWGLENSPASGTNSFSLLAAGFDTKWHNVLAVGFLAGDTAFTGFNFFSNYGIYVICDGMGNQCAKVSGANNQPIITQSFFGDTNSFGMQVDGTAGGVIVQSSSTGYGPVATSGFTGLNVNNGATWYSVGDRFLCYATVQNFGAQIASGSAGFFDDSTGCLSVGFTTDIGLKVRDNNSKAYAHNSVFTGGGTGNCIQKTADTSFFFNQGGVYCVGSAASGLAPACAMTSGGGTGPACALQTTSGIGSDNSSGVIIMTPGTTPAATGTTTLTFAGTWQTDFSNPVCTFTLVKGTGTWDARASVQLTTQSTTAPILTWDNNAVALTAASTYMVSYMCRPM